MDARCLARTLHYSWPTCTCYKIIKLILLWRCLGRGGLLWNTNSWGASCGIAPISSPLLCKFCTWSVFDDVMFQAYFGEVTMALVIILFCRKILPLHELGILCWGTPPKLPTTPRILDSNCVVMTKCKPVFYGLILQFLIFYRPGALATIYLSCHTIPLLSVSQPQYISAIDLLSLTLIGSHRQMCPCLR